MCLMSWFSVLMGFSILKMNYVEVKIINIGM